MLNKKLYSQLTILLLVVLCGFSGSLFAFTITSFSPSVFNPDTATMNTTLGLDNSYTFEDFEDLNFAPGFTLTSPGADFFGLTTASDQVWEGGTAMHIRQNARRNTTFTFAEGIGSFGLALSQLETSRGLTNLVVNGSNLGSISNLPGYVDASVQQRNLYLKVDAQAGEVINSLALSHAPTEGLTIDHLAFRSAVPEANSLLLLLMATVLVGVKRKRLL